MWVLHRLGTVSQHDADQTLLFACILLIHGVERDLQIHEPDFKIYCVSLHNTQHCRTSLFILLIILLTPCEATHMSLPIVPLGGWYNGDAGIGVTLFQPCPL